jgi:hypothetical protein
MYCIYSRKRIKLRDSHGRDTGSGDGVEVGKGTLGAWYLALARLGRDRELSALYGADLEPDLDNSFEQADPLTEFAAFCRGGGAILVKSGFELSKLLGGDSIALATFPVGIGWEGGMVVNGDNWIQRNAGCLLYTHELALRAFREVGTMAESAYVGNCP